MTNFSRILVFCLTAAFCLVPLIASAAVPQSVNFAGTVRYVALEGGFWGIVSAEGAHYQPINLEPDFKQDGLAVRVAATPVIRPSIHMWGTTIEITSITKLETDK
ncbi:MAG: hypothetical protein P4N41_08190 [Negativicutes bacterium]|nr:hypothetical protein [Negativicutes bacterium]